MRGDCNSSILNTLRPIAAKITFFEFLYLVINVCFLASNKKCWCHWKAEDMMIMLLSSEMTGDQYSAENGWLEVKIVDFMVIFNLFLIQGSIYSNISR